MPYECSIKELRMWNQPFACAGCHRNLLPRPSFAQISPNRQLLELPFCVAFLDYIGRFAHPSLGDIFHVLLIADRGTAARAHVLV